MEAPTRTREARFISAIAAQMIRDIEYLGREWGRRMRHQPYGWYRKNHLANHLQDYLIGFSNSYKVRAISSDNLDQYEQNSYRSGAWNTNGLHMTPSASAFDSLGTLGSNPPSGSRQRYRFFRPEPPVGFMSEDQLLFHRAYRRFGECHQAILWTHFVPKVSSSRKLTLLNATQRQYEDCLALSVQAVIREITAIELETPKSHAREKSKTPRVTPLWPCKVIPYRHKVAINDSHRDPFPICLTLTGHIKINDHFVRQPIDETINCFTDEGELYARIPRHEWKRLRSRKILDSTLATLRAGSKTEFETTERPIRRIHQTKEGRWQVGSSGHLDEVGKQLGMDNIALAMQHPTQDCLRAIEGFDNKAFIATQGSDLAFDSKAMRGIQNPHVQAQITQRLVEYNERLDEAKSAGLGKLTQQLKLDMKDFKSLTKDSCVTKDTSTKLDDGDPFNKIMCKLRIRKIRALRKMKKLGLTEEAEDLDGCYKIEGRTAIFFPANSRFIWKFSSDIKRTP